MQFSNFNCLGLSSGPATTAAQVKARALVPRRILFTCEDFEIGGISTHTILIGSGLRKQGYQVGALSPEPFGSCYDDFRRHLDYVDIVRRGLETREQYLRRLVRRIAMLKPDVIINSGLHWAQAAMPFLPEPMIRISMMHSIHDREITLCGCHRSFVDHIVTVSENTLAAAKAGPGMEAPIRTIPVAIEVPREEAARTGCQEPARLIYAGRLAPEKNIPGLLSILSLLSTRSVPFRMTIVGKGPELGPARAQVSASSYRQQVRFTGALSRQELSRELQQHDLLLLTSHYEGTPHAVLEAMAHGVVVLASRLPGATDKIITPGVDGFLCERQRPETYVTVIEMLMHHPEQFAAVSGAGRLAVRRRYSLETVLPQYEAVFARTRPAQSRVSEPPGVPPEFWPYCPGLLRQCKHRVGDIWRRLARGTRPVKHDQPPLVYAER